MAIHRVSQVVNVAPIRIVLLIQTFRRVRLAVLKGPGETLLIVHVLVSPQKARQKHPLRVG